MAWASQWDQLSMQSSMMGNIAGVPSYGVAGVSSPLWDHPALLSRLLDSHLTAANACAWRGQLWHKWLGYHLHTLIDWQHLAIRPSSAVLWPGLQRDNVHCNACGDRHFAGRRHTSAVNSASSAAFSCSRAAAAAASASSSTPRMAACISSADTPSLPAPAAIAPGKGVVLKQPQSCSCAEAQQMTK